VRLLTIALQYLSSNDLEGFEKAHEGTIAMLPVASRKHLTEYIGHLGKKAAAKEATP